MGSIDLYLAGRTPLKPTSNYGQTAGGVWTPMLVATDGSLAVSLDAGLPSLTGRLLSAAGSTNDTNVKASAATLYGIQGYNARASAVYLKLYNLATTPVVGTTVPVKTLYLPATTAFAFDWPEGYSFSAGLGFGLTTAVADNSTAAVTAADILALNLDYA